MPPPVENFVLPVALNLAAVGVFALSGAGEAIRRGYDIVGVAALAIVTAIGGAFLRDILLGDTPPPLLTDGRYVLAILAGALAALPFQKLIARLSKPMLTIDALGLAVFTIVGSHKALTLGVSVPAAILIGVINGVGGSIARDVLTRQEPLLFRPGQYYAAAAAVGAGLFCALRELGMHIGVSVSFGIGSIMVIRLLAVTFNWRTHAALMPAGARSVVHSGPHR